MIKFFSTLILLSFVTVGQAQVVEAKIPTDLANINAVYHFNRGEKNCFFLFEETSMQFAQLSKDLNIEQSLLIPLHQAKGTFASYLMKDNHVLTTFWMSQKEVYALHTDLKESTTTAKSYSIKEDNEQVLAYITYEQSFYILKVVKNSNYLKLLQFDANLSLVSSTLLNFSDQKFFNRHNEKTDLYSVLREETRKESSMVTPIVANQRTSLIKASAKRKLYVFDSNLYITLDNSKLRTICLSVNLLTKQTNTQVFNQNYDISKSLIFDSNSFMFDDKLIQASFTREYINFIIRDLAGVPIKTFRLDKKEKADFLIGDISKISDNAFGRDKASSFTKTKRFLFNMMDYNAQAIAAYPYEDSYILTFGGVSDLKKTLTPGRDIFAYLMVSPNRTSIFNEYYNATAMIATGALTRELEPNPTLTLPEDKLADLRYYNNFDPKDPKYKVVFKVKDQYYYGKQETGSKTLDLVSF